MKDAITNRRCLVGLALLACMTAMPAWGQVCNLSDGTTGSSTATGTQAVACGTSNNANGTLADASGVGNTAGNYGTAVGNQNTAGDHATAVGVQSRGNGGYSVAVGYLDYATGEHIQRM